MKDADREYMGKAIEQAKLDHRPHKVGAVIVKEGKILGLGYGGQYSEVEHAEGGLLERQLAQFDLKGATLYTTLEPCTRRRHPNYSCAEVIKQRGIGRVVIGILDPNPDIKHSGELFLRKHGIEIEHSDADLQTEIESLMGDWVKEQRRRTTYSELFSRLETLVADDILTLSLPGLAIETVLTLRICPDVTRGWLMKDISIIHSTDVFKIPHDQSVRYQEYFNAHYDRMRFDKDNPKIMLAVRPKAYSDAPDDLRLETKETKYSHIHFYKDVIASDQESRKSLMASVAAGQTTTIPFPNAFCLHMVVATIDGKLLITRRAPDLDWYPNKWSCSMEEQISFKDLNVDHRFSVLHWGKRALFEELGITEATYLDDNLRVLSVFLETDVLNISMCGIVTLNISSAELSRIIRSLPRVDYEFNAWDFLEYEDQELMREILNPSPRTDYLPTSRYRMLMALMKKNGLPAGAERFFRS